MKEYEVTVPIFHAILGFTIMLETTTANQNQDYNSTKPISSRSIEL